MEDENKRLKSKIGEKFGMKYFKNKIEEIWGWKIERAILGWGKYEKKGILWKPFVRWLGGWAIFYTAILLMIK